LESVLLQRDLEDKPYSISSFELPHDIGWANIDDTPAEARRALEIYNCAKRDDVDGSILPIDSIDEYYEAFDGLQGQKVAIAKDEHNIIIGVDSLDHKRTPPFFEGVTVHPSHRGSGVARQLIAYLFTYASEAGIEILHARSQQSSLMANRRVLESLGVSFDVLENEKFPLMIIDLRGHKVQ
jgi:GNAT superfamily N-acetyltransferase